ncbi:MAG TPA: hydrogen peroxide-inducible genes activator [Devosiaceae bacterium]
MSMTLKQMRYALAVAEEGHFGRAAQRCHVTQPALSQQIRLLEETAGRALFDRLAKSVRPTPFGREFLARVRRIVDAADELDAFALSGAAHPTRPVRFGLIPTIAPYILPDLFPALARDAPGVEFAVNESRTDALLEGLERGEIDLAMIATDPPKSAVRLTIEPLFADPFVLAASRGSSIEEPVDLASLSNRPMLLLEEGHCFRDQAIAACGIRDDAARTFAATSLPTVVELVASGQGVTLLPAISLRKEATDPRIRICALAAPGAGRMLSLAWREGSPYSALFARIARTVRSTGLARLSEALPERGAGQLPG